MDLRKLANALFRLLKSYTHKPKGSIWEHYSRDASILASWLDVNDADLQSLQQHPENLKAEVSSRTCNWYLPAFTYPYFGGVMTILRLADFMKKTAGITSRFIIVGDFNHKKMYNAVIAAFPSLEGVQIMQAPKLSEMDMVPSSDYSIATLWTTAFYVLRAKNTALKFYMVQDDEQQFYPAGSTSAQVELTYQMGFYGICNTRTLREKYLNYGGDAVTLLPAVDPKIFHPNSEIPRGTQKKIFLYARPNTPRNMFELIAPALVRVKHQLGSDVQIICAGSDWNPKEYGLHEIVEYQGLLSYEATAALYRTCDIGISFMQTPHPSYLPFELMASKVAVIANLNADNSWFLKDGHNCLIAKPTVSSISDAIIKLVKDDQLRNTLAANGLVTIRNSHSDWDKSLEVVLEWMLKK